MSKCECKNCIHYEICNIRLKSISLDPVKCGYKCPHYKGKSLCVELPCKVGDTVYMPWKWNGQKGIAQLRVTTMLEIIGLGLDFGTNFETDDDAYYEEYNGGRFGIKDVGKTVFLTKEEAERKLKEIEKK